MLSERQKKIMDTPEFKEIAEELKVFGAPALFEKYVKLVLKEHRGVEYNRDSLGGYIQGMADSIKFFIRDDDDGARELATGFKVGSELWKDKYAKNDGTI